ncbi:unnamed protein product [Ixodes persulcatus]
MDNIKSKTLSAEHLIVRVPRLACSAGCEKSPCTTTSGSQSTRKEDIYVIPGGSNLLTNVAEPPQQSFKFCSSGELMQPDDIFGPELQTCKNRVQVGPRMQQKDSTNATVREIEQCSWFQKAISLDPGSELIHGPGKKQITCPDCVLELIRKEQRPSKMPLVRQPSQAAAGQTMVVEIPPSSEQYLRGPSANREVCMPGVSGGSSVTVIQRNSSREFRPGRCKTCGTCKTCWTPTFS